jgi:hypothetical protein
MATCTATRLQHLLLLGQEERLRAHNHQHHYQHTLQHHGQQQH